MKHNWEYKRLGDVCDKASSNLMQKSLVFVEDGYAVYGASGYLGQIESFAHEKPYIGIVKDGSGVGRVSIYPAKSSILGTMQYILVKDGINNAYLMYVLKFLNLSKYVSGAAIPHIYFKDYKKEVLPVPPMEVQQQIVAELDQINDLIAKNRELLSQLDALAQSLFYDTFGDPISNPKGWDVSKIGAISSVQTGATPSREIEANFCGEIPWVKTTEVQNCNILNTAEHISEDAMENSNCKIFPIDTILVAMYGQGKTRGQIARLKIEACTNQACAAILPSTTLHPSFLFSFLLASYEPLRSVAVGCNQKNLNLSLIKNYPIFLPPLAMQEEFAAKVEAIEAQKAKVEAEIAELQTLFDARMDYWFN